MVQMEKVARDDASETKLENENTGDNDDMLLTIDETNELENCDTIDLGDPFEEYDGATSKFDYGDNTIHRSCVKNTNPKDKNRPDEKVLLNLREEKKKELI
jgi:hypothetical protein